ncbi:hypothetical protein [Pelagicoccus sp. SDUM812005]|uniref:hypothetical protein n=1 Tax=Pelagicoccus sp. SDUM812005 TaxID=3041257 RepID=UPI00280F370C|nr:hypothetical protein [Pelagicoccus sp. SDUM812005]MDQ8182362.1 hypothetical protein [Pelagicoccus sp. SDUM812005]
MTQSDSPDFEFDISDLEVEREESAASKSDSSMSGSSDEELKGIAEQVAGDDDVKPDPRADFDESDRELDVFEIDDLPSSAPQVASAAKPTEAAREEPEAQPVQKVERKPEPSSSRVLGDDDLGADVFAEIESELGGMGLDDVIDDLMEEVEDYEAGGFVDLDEDEASEVSASSDDLFKMADPDDSLRNSVDPNAIEGDELEEAPAFPSPPADFEIPADPEPPREPARSETPVSEAPVQPPPASPREQPAAKTIPDFSDVEIPADPSPAVASQPAPQPAPQAGTVVAPDGEPEVPVVAEVLPQAEAPSTAEVPASPPSKKSSETAEPSEGATIGASGRQEAAGAEPSGSSGESKLTVDPQVTAAVESPADSGPVDRLEESVEEAEEVAAVAEEKAIESLDQDLGAVEPAAPVEGREQVLFSAEDEEVLPDPLVEGPSEELLEDPILQKDEEASASAGGDELIEEALAEGVEDSESDIEATPELAAPEAMEAPAFEEAEAEDEEDLSALLGAVEEDLAEEGDLSAKLDETESAEAEQSSVASPEGADDVPVVAGEAETPEIEATLGDDEEDEDLSELLASVVEDDPEEQEEPEPAAEVPGLVEVEEEEVPGLTEILEEEPAVSGGEESDALETEALVSDEPAAGAEFPGLVEVDEDLDEEDISSLIDEASEGEESDAEAPASSPGLDILDDDEEELVELPVPEVPALVEVEEEPEAESEEAAAASSVVKSTPSAEDLLMQAGSLLNGNSEKPAEGASALLDVLEDDDDEIISMPSPDEMIADAAGDGDEDDEVVALPDPSSLITEDGEAVAVIEDDDEEDVPAPGNVADRAGDLPPPPPAPVEILDDEPPEEDRNAAVIADGPDTGSEEVEDSEEVIEDPFAGEISLDDFSEGFAELDVEEGAEDGAEEISGEEVIGAEDGDDAKVAAANVVEMPKRSLLWRVTHSMAVAAGLVLVGLAGVLAVWKQQIVEYYDGRDIDGSALLLEIEEIGKHALSKFDEQGLYRMQWVDSEVRRVSENEIRLHAVVGARLRENLYRPVLESRLKEEKGYDEEKLMESLGYARDHFPEEIGHFPDRPWNRLYEISAKKEEVLPLRVTYGLQRESEADDWALTRIKVSGYKGDLEWPEGDPKYAFGENAYDIHSPEFAKVYEDYSLAAQNYVARIDRMRAREEGNLLALKRENERQRERVKMALSEGAFFNGLAILGEDAANSRDVQLVITEVRNDGGFVKGVVKLTGDKQLTSKHFVGSLEFEKSMSGREQGYLSLRTVSIDAPTTATAESPFFDAHNVSRMRLRADGFRLEGDSRDLSFRLTRSL